MEKPDIESISLRMENIWRAAGLRIMQDVIRRIKKNRKITSTADYQINRLLELGQTTEEVEKTLKEALNATYPEIFRLYDEVSHWQYVRNRNVYEQVNGNFIPPEENEWLKRMSEAVKRQTKDELVNLAQSYGFSVMIGNRRAFTPFSMYYHQYVDAAIMDVISGAFDYNTVIRRVVKQMTDSGLRTVDYATGRSNRVDVAVRRAVMTGISQITEKVNEQTAKELGTDYFEVDWHANARPSHREWQGKVYSKEELETVCGLHTVTGLHGANCRHDYYAFVPGSSKRMYSDEWLEEQNRKEAVTKKWQGKEYDAYERTQKQRQMETAMRAQREKVQLLKDSKVSEDEIMLARCKYQAQLNEYSRYCKKMNLPEQRERIYYDMRGRVAPGKASYQKYLAQERQKRENKVRIKILEKSKADFSNHITVFNNGQKDLINHKNLYNNLNKTEIGKDTLSYLKRHPEIKISMCYKVDNPENLYGFVERNDIYIFASETQTVQKTAETIIHEITHHKYKIGNSQWSECVCKVQEMKHRLKKNTLTGKELRIIIKEVKELYPEYRWR